MYMYFVMQGILVTSLGHSGLQADPRARTHQQSGEDASNNNISKEDHIVFAKFSYN
jgi:hypothetical protein